MPRHRSSRVHEPPPLPAGGLSPLMRMRLEALYRCYNHREFVHPDPLELLYAYKDPRDREIAGMVASTLAFGRVSQILNSAGAVLSQLGKPRQALERATRSGLEKAFAGFRHRFVAGRELVDLLYAVKSVMERWGTLEAAFLDGFQESDETVLAAAERFVSALRASCGCDVNYLLPQPERGSACKRLHLFLRWMIRRDEVDPGGWESIPASKLVCPVDTHMHRIGRALGFTRRARPDGRCALEITGALRAADPADPVRFDFGLTRLGIRRDGDVAGFIRACGRK